MTERRTRWNELLGVPNEIRHPDLYQLLGMDRRTFDPTRVEDAVRSRMAKLQATRSTKHKEFIEFAKGELRRARRLLADEQERAAYDAELLEERVADLRRVIVAVLACGHFVKAAEDAVVAAGRELGMTDAEARSTLEAVLARTTEAAPTPAPEPVPAPELPEGVSIEPLEPAAPIKVADAETIRRTIRRWGEPVAEREARRRRTGRTPVGGIPRPPSSLPSLEPLRRCGACGRGIPDMWRELAAAERIGTRLLCTVCASAVHGNEACAACSRALGPLDGATWSGMIGRVCETCAARVTRLKVCARCELVLPPTFFERGEAHAHAGKSYCSDCFRAVATS